MDGLSDDGIKLFGKFLQHCGEQQGLMTQKAIAVEGRSRGQCPVEAGLGSD